MVQKQWRMLKAAFVIIEGYVIVNCSDNKTYLSTDTYTDRSDNIIPRRPLASASLMSTYCHGDKHMTTGTYCNLAELGLSTTQNKGKQVTSLAHWHAPQADRLLNFNSPLYRDKIYRRKKLYIFRRPYVVGRIFEFFWMIPKCFQYTELVFTGDQWVIRPCVLHRIPNHCVKFINRAIFGLTPNLTETRIKLTTLKQTKKNCKR